MTDDEWHIPDRLYHGTTAAAARKAFEQGLQPRRVTKRSNWKAFESRLDYTYLTDAYAPYYATCATRGDSKWGIVEVDLACLDWRRLRPEEDAMEQSTRGIADWSPVEDPQLRAVFSRMPQTDMVQRTAYVQRNADRLKKLWWFTLKRMGTCAYRGPIPAEAITRVALYDPRSNFFVTATAIDPTVTVENYRMLAGRYRLLTQWFFEPVTAERWMAEAEFPGMDMVLSGVGPGQYEAYVSTRREALANRTGLSVLTRGVDS